MRNWYVYVEWTKGEKKTVSQFGRMVKWLLAAMSLLRVRREERLLVEAFGDAYRGYAGRTGRVVPRQL